jgi:PAS domain S-box-containing protein
MDSPDVSPDRLERRRLQALERVDRILVGATDLKLALDAALDELLEIFDADRAFLLHPCDPRAEKFRVPIERTRAGWPGARELDVEIPLTGFTQTAMGAACAGSGALRMDPERDPVPADDPTVRAFGIRSLLAIALRMPGRAPWMLGLHHCRSARVFRQEVPVFEAVAARLGEALARLLAQRELERNEARFRTLLEHAPEAIVILDVGSERYVDCNGNARALFGWSHEELCALGPEQTSPRFQPDGRASRDAARAWIARAVAGETPVFEWTHLDARGRELPCEVRLVRLPDSERVLVRGSVTDISERKRAQARQRALEEQLRQAQKMEALGHLTGGVAHDFNNILTVIQGNTELARALLDHDHAARAHLDGVLTAARKGALLTQRLLAFSRKQALVPTSIDPGALVRGLEVLLARTLGETIGIETVIGAGTWNCEADRSQLEHAVLNLAINARDAMPEGGRMTIEVSNAHLDREYCEREGDVAPGQYVQLAVSDDGCGMAPEVLAQAFEPFFTTKDVGKGSGLGLSMVYGFAKQSRGHVKLYSELGQGTTVRLYLPRSTRAADQPPAADGAGGDPRGRGEWILVVEDDASVRGFIVLVLESLGYRTHQADSAQGALALLERRVQVDLLLTDVVLPGGVDGAQLARRAVGQRTGMRVLFMSGYTENAIIHQGRLDPGVELLGKPFSRAGLARAVRGVLDGKRS